MSYPMMVSEITKAKAELKIPRLWRWYHLPGEPGLICDNPFTTERQPGFSVSDDGLRFIDFQQPHDRGDAIDFLAKILGVSRVEGYCEFIRLYRAWLARKEAKNREKTINREVARVGQG
jgi:hypothetical protein